MKSNNKIPKIIHYCWFGGNTKPKSVKSCLKSWELYCPDYKIIEWNESNFDINSNLYVKQAYENKKWAFVTDFVRLKVLYDNGGIYMDTDVEVRKSLDCFLDHEAFSGFEWIDRIPTGIIGAKKNNNWIEKILRHYNDVSFVNSDGTFNTTTNVQIITNSTRENYPIKLDNTKQDLIDVTFYPFDWFCAKDLNDGLVKVSNNTHTIHHFSGSWLPPKKKMIRQFRELVGYKTLKKIIDIKRLINGNRG